jgi:capsular polysaccharide export protein
MTRNFLFLQGVCSPFFHELAIRVSALNAGVFRINFTAGDNVLWKGSNSISFNRPINQLPDFIAKAIAEYDITDLVVFGDTRPIHRPAIEIARSRGLRVHVFEEGYFRPYWITLERGGVNGYSSLPKDPVWYLEAGKRVPKYDNGRPFTSSFLLRAWHDVCYNGIGIINPLFYRHYRHHAPVGPFVEYAHYLRRGTMVSLIRKRINNTVNDLLASKRPFYLVPLQLESDSQIRIHSQFKNMAEMLTLVMRSFALHAPNDAILVIKNHPLDSGVVNHGSTVSMLSDEYDISERIIYLEDGSLPDLLRHARGVVTVNSTVGGSSLVHMCPTIALGCAVYNMEGLTFQGGLDRFWIEPIPPDQLLLRHFRNVVIHTTQINGGFYTRDGIEMAIEHAAPAIMADRSPLEELL